MITTMSPWMCCRICAQATRFPWYFSQLFHSFVISLSFRTMSHMSSKPSLPRNASDSEKPPPRRSCSCPMTRDPLAGSCLEFYDLLYMYENNSWRLRELLPRTTAFWARPMLLSLRIPSTNTRQEPRSLSQVTHRKCQLPSLTLTSVTTFSPLTYKTNLQRYLTLAIECVLVFRFFTKWNYLSRQIFLSRITEFPQIITRCNPSVWRRCRETSSHTIISCRNWRYPSIATTGKRIAGDNWGIRWNVSLRFSRFSLDLPGGDLSRVLWRPRNPSCRIWWSASRSRMTVLWSSKVFNKCLF